MPEKDITQTGPVGLRGLSAVDKRKDAEDRFSSLSLDEMYNNIGTSISPRQAHQQVLRELGEFQPMSSGQDIGSSIFDKNIYSPSEFEMAGDIRAENQPGLLKIGAGFVKLGTTAATTFLDGTLGSIIGLVQGAVNAVDDDPKTTFRNGMWNNAFNKAMAEFQEKMESAVPNYYSSTELDNPWYKNLGTANFWGDKFLKNMGFTIGAMATLAVPGFNMSWVPKAGMGIAKALGAGYSGLKFANKAGKVATQALRTIVSANGEAAIEAVNAVQDNYDSEIANLENRKREAVQEANEWYAQHQYDVYNELYANPREIYLKRLAQIDSEYDSAKKEIENGLVNVGNSVHLANMAILSLTNTLEFGNYLKGGYNLQKGFKNLKMLANGEETTSMREFARAATEGKAALAKAPISGTQRTGKIVAGSLGRAASEGFEEGAQRLASDTEQMKEQARVNQWASDTDDTFYGRGINPDISEDLVDRVKALHHAWNTAFGDLSSSGWEEVFLGALTGGVGTINVRQNRQGKVGLGWQGGIAETIRDIKDEEQDATKYIEMFNKRIQSEDFRNRYKHAVTAMSLTEEMDNFLNLGKVLEYKNREMLKVVNDAYFFKDMEAMDFYKSFYEEMAKGLSEEDVALVREELKPLNENISPFGSMTNSEIAETIQDKAKSTLQKINKTLELYDYLNLKYQDKAFEAASKVLKDDTYFVGGSAAMAEVLLREVASEASVIWDMERRKEQLQEEIDTMDEGTRAIRGTIYEERGIAELEKEIDRRKKLYDKNLSDFEGLAKTIKRVNDLAIRRTAIKDNRTYKEAFKNATNLQEVADLYFTISEGAESNTLDDEQLNNRQIVFEDALEEAEGENKALLESFKPFLASVNAINSLIDEIVEDKIRLSEDADTSNIENIVSTLNSLRENAKNVLREEVQYTIRSYIEDPRSPYDKGSLSTALRDRVEVYKKLAEASPEDAEGLNNTADTLQEIADELDKLDVLYAAAVRDSESTEEDEGSVEGEEEVAEEEEESAGEGEEKPESKGENDKEESEEPDTTIVRNRKDAKKYANRRLKKALGDDYDRFVQIIEQDDPSQEDREWFDTILKGKRKSFDNFIKNYVREFKEDYEDENSGGNGSGVVITEDKKTRDKDISDTSDTSMRTNPYRPYLQGSGMNDEEGLTDSELSNEDTQKQIEDSKKRPGIINGIGVLALENAVNKKYYENWYKHKFFGSIAQGIDYITNNLLWDLMQTGTDGKLKVLYAEYYPKDGSRQTVFSGFRKPHILLVTPYNSKVEGVVKKNTAQAILAKNIIESIDKNGKAQKYLVVGAYGYSSGNKVLSTGHDLIDKAIIDQRQASSINNEWEVLEEGENGKYVNYIYDISPGYALRQHSEEDTGNRSLKDLLEHNNPSGQTAKDIRISYWVGDENSPEGIYPKWIHNKAGDKFYEGEYAHNPGDMFVWMPTADGHFIPQRISPIAFKELRQGVNGQVYEDIMNLIRTIAENRTNKKEIKKAIAALRGTDEIPGMLVLSSRNNKGTRIEYSESEGVIVFVKDGVNLVDENIYLEREGTTTESVIKQLTEMLGEGHKTEDSEESNGLNALVAIHGSKLASNPNYYIDSNIINVNLRQWGTVNARGFAYPIRPDGSIDPLYVPQPLRSVGRTAEDPFKESTWFNGHKYVYDTATGVVRDSDNREVTDKEVLDQINDIRTIKEGRLKPLIDNGAKYYLVGDRVYYSPRRNSYTRVDGERLDAVRKKAAVQEALDELREVTHTKEELESALEKLSHKLNTITVSNKEVATFEPQTLEELVVATLYAYKSGEYEPNSFLKEGVDPIVIKTFSRGVNKFFSKDGTHTLKALVDDLYHEALERGFIRDDQQGDVLTAVINAIDVSVLGTGYGSLKGRLRDNIKDFVREQKSLEIKSQIDAINDELGVLTRKEGKETKQEGPEEDLPFETLTEEQKEEERKREEERRKVAQLPINKEQLEEKEKLQRQERIATFGNLYEELAEDFFSDEELMNLTLSVFDKIGAEGATDAAEKIYDSEKTRSMLLKMNDKGSLIDLLRKIDECGI